MTDGPTAITDRDDAVHEHGGEPGWSERLSFVFFDAAQVFGGVVRMGAYPSDGRADGTVNLFVPGDTIATVLAKEPYDRARGTSVGRIDLTREAPLGAWSVSCHDVALVFPNAGPAGLPRAGERQGGGARLELDLRFEPWMDPVGTVTRDKRVDDMGFVQVVSGGRFEQAGRFTGKVRLGANQGTIDGAGVRERTWGPPQAGPAERGWLAAAFGPGLSFGIRVAGDGRARAHDGWVCRDGRARALTEVHLDTETEGRTVVRLRLALTDEAGDRYELDGDTRTTLPLRDGSARIRQSLVRYVHDGRETLGLAEFADDVVAS